MSFKLSFRNVKRSFKDYAIYFLTLILGVAIFYLFNSLDSQQAMLSITGTKLEIMDLMIQLLSGVSVFVSIVLCFLVVYANRFLIKRRKKEFGVYLTLGMGKGKIAGILLFETIFVGIISLFIGLILGVFLSQGMSIFIAKLFEADMSKFKFVLSNAAIIKTIIYFSIMYILVMLFNIFTVSRCKLIDLLTAVKRNEKLKIKNPIIVFIVFIMSVVMLAYAYYHVTSELNVLADEMIFICIGLGIVGTFLFFWSLSGFILRLIQLKKGTYFKDLNMFVLRQINSKINTTVFSMTIICILLFLTICIFSSAVSLNHSLNKSIKELTPVDINIMSNQMVMNSKKVNTIEVLKNGGYNVEEQLGDYVYINSYVSNDVTIDDTFGKIVDNIKKDYPYLRLDQKEEIMSVSDYNKVAKLYGKEQFTLNDNEYIIIANYKSMIDLRNKALEDNTILNIGTNQLQPKYNEVQDGFIRISGNQENAGIIIVPDKVVEKLYPKYSIVSGNYINSNKDIGEKEALLAIDILNKNNKDNVLFYVNTKIDIQTASVGLGAIVTFIGLYLGIVFLISSAAILALKELSDSSDNAQRYGVLRKIGCNSKMINKALFMQIGIFFLIPLILAIVHSIFGIIFANHVLVTIAKQDLLIPIIITSLFILIIYGGYFLVTYYCSKNIISEK